MVTQNSAQHRTNYPTLDSTFGGAIGDINLTGVLFTVRKIDLILIGGYTQSINNDFVRLTLTAGATGEK